MIGDRGVVDEALLDDPLAVGFASTVPLEVLGVFDEVTADLVRDETRLEIFFPSVLKPERALHFLAALGGGRSARVWEGDG